MIGNVPAQVTSFVGRREELLELGELLCDSRLVTLTGVGGCGKTRLAIELAAGAADRFPDGVWFVDLAPVRLAAHVPFALASALNLGRWAGRRLLEETLWQQLGSKRLLIVMDNCEHLIDASARIAVGALVSCPKLRIVATSREPLNVPGELSWRVPPLRERDALRLFLDRAALVRASSITRELREQRVAELCRRLDGLPLALELAAVRLRSMTLEQILAHLENRFRLLSSGARTALPRQQTLRATVDWSYELLAKPQRLLFRRLGVFAGDFGMSTAEAVCGTDGLAVGDVLQLLPQLVDMSMVQAEPAAGEGIRYRLLETLREYGKERLHASGEADRVRRRHAEHFLLLAETGESLGPGREDPPRSERDVDNIRAALDWYAENDRSGLLRLASGLGWFWVVHGNIGEGRRHLEMALAAVPERSILRAKALRFLGHLERVQGDIALALTHQREALAIGEELMDENEIAETLVRLGTTFAAQGDFSASASCHERALAIYERLGDRAGVLRAHVYQGLRSYFQGDLERADTLFEEALADLRSSTDRFHTAIALMLRGRVALEHGRHKRARSLLVESLSLLQHHGNRFWTTLCLDALAGLAAAGQQDERALNLAGAASAARDTMGAGPLPPAVQSSLERWLAPARRRSGRKGGDRAWERGRAIPLDNAVADALGGFRATGPTFTPRERQMVEFVSQGLTNRQMARRLALSVRTVDGHLERVRSKLGCSNRVQIAAWFANNR